jgi:hypothetical protein
LFERRLKLQAHGMLKDKLVINDDAASLSDEQLIAVSLPFIRFGIDREWG